jgi:hypothetical protein
MYNFGIAVLNPGGGKMGLKHRAKEAYIDSEVAKMVKDQQKVKKLFVKYEKEAARERNKYTKLARRMIRGIDEDETIHISFRDRRPNDRSPIIELWDEDDNYIILLCTIIKPARFHLSRLHAIVECDKCGYQHRMLGREIAALRDIYLAMNDPKPSCRNVRNP